MKYSLKYYSMSRYLDTIDELRIDYTKRNLELIDFVEHRPAEQRLAVNISTLNNEEIEESIDIFKVAAEKHLNIVFITNYFNDIQIFKDNNLKFFYESFILSWDELNGVAADGVSDVYICSELGFQMDKVGAFCHARGINVRVFPNIAQSNGYWVKSKVSSITKFFIRPEDVPHYEPYVDYMELVSPLKDMDHCYDIYKSQKWLGKLNQIIIDYDGDEYNRELSSIFGAFRTTCGKRCNYISCSKCFLFSSLSSKLFENNLTLKYPEVMYTKEEYEKRLKEYNEEIAKFNINKKEG